MMCVVSETEWAKRFAKIRLNGTAFNRRLNCTIVVRTVPNLSVENAQRKHVRSCVDCTHTQGDRERAGEFELKQSKANRKSSPENCLWSISNRIQKMWKTRKDRARYKYGAAFVWACCYCMCVCVVIFFHIFCMFAVLPFSLSLYKPLQRLLR